MTFFRYNAAVIRFVPSVLLPVPRSKLLNRKMNLNVIVSVIVLLAMEPVGSSLTDQISQKCFKGDFSDLLQSYSFDEWAKFPVEKVLRTRVGQGQARKTLGTSFPKAFRAVNPRNTRDEISDLKKRNKARPYSLLFLLTALDLIRQRKSEFRGHSSKPAKLLLQRLLKDAAEPVYLFSYSEKGLSGRLDWTGSLCKDSSCKETVVVPGFTSAMAVLYSMFYVPGVNFNDHALLSFVEFAHEMRSFTAASARQFVCRLKKTPISRIVPKYGRVVSWLLRGAPTDFDPGLEPCSD